MASTRRAPPLQVHEDPDASQLNRSDHGIEAALLNALGPLGDASNQQNFRLPPSNHSRPGSSPTKQPSPPTQPLDTTDLKEITIPPPSPPKFATDSPRKRNAPFMPMYPQPVQQQQAQPLFAQYSVAQPYDKENHYDQMMYQSFRPMPYNEIQYAPPISMKRPHPDENEAQSKDKAVKKQKLERDDGFELPDPEDMPPVYDDGAKPQHSYAELIGMAILRSPTRRLTLAQIYKWISDHFSFYKSSDSGWQNSIRHNLSLNKNFIKQERPKDDPGKGNYWAIKPGEERPFLLGRKNPMRRITNPDGSQYLHALPAEMGGFRPATAPAISQFTLAPTPSSATKKAEAKIADSVKLPDEADVSSDATIPASDAGLQDDERDDAAAMPPPPSHFRSSPPPADIGSSPPQMPAPQRRGTPPPAPRFPSTSRSGSRRQKFSKLGDSGYWSSIESSAIRNNANHPTSEADIPRPRIKKGRAEAEIARMRSSSFDSPIKERPNIRLSASELPTSSPVRDDQPLTPAVVFKRPPKPPPSVSPNTNLRNHRNRMRALLGTPAKLFNAVENDTPNWSPAFHLGEDGAVGLTPGISPYKASKTPWRPFQDLAAEGSVSNNSIFNSAFDVFIDAPEEDLTARGSPEKRTNPASTASARRPSLARAATSTGILADITGSSRSNFVTLAPPASGNNSPFSLSPFIVKPAFQHSPNKAHGASPLKQAHLPPPSSHGSAGHANPPKWGLQDGLPAIDTENLHPSGNLAGGGSAVNASAAGITAVATDIDAAVDLFGVHLPSDGSEEGIDLFQDFGKIGASFQQHHQQQSQHHHSVSLGLPGLPNTADGSPIKRTALSAAAGDVAGRGRPPLGRHMSNRW